MLVNKSLLLILPILTTTLAFMGVIPRHGLAHQHAIITSQKARELFSSSDNNADVNGIPPTAEGIPPTTEALDDEPTTTPTALDTKAAKLKHKLLMLAEQCNRGFQASSQEREQVKELILQLAPLNPTAEPAAPYYDGATKKDETCTLSGKWTLVYTDAPDITGLDTSRVPFSTAQLGRIGQECSPPYIKNVIEWKRPEWARNLPFSGSDESRVLQKVVTSASASPDRPRVVNLKVAGLEIEAKSSDENSMSEDLTSRIQKDGLIAGLLSINPIDLKGPLNPPFGQFEVLYLDDDFRIIKTYQNYFAVNQRIKEGEEWF